MRDEMVVTPTAVEVTLISETIAVTELIDTLRLFQVIARESWRRVASQDLRQPRLAVTALSMESPFRARLNWVVPAAAGSIVLGYSAGFFGAAGTDSYRYLQTRFAEAPTLSEDGEHLTMRYGAQFLKENDELDSRILSLVEYLATRGITIQVRVIDETAAGAAVDDGEG